MSDACGNGSPWNLTVLLLEVFPEHGAPFGLVKDIGYSVALAQYVELLVKLVGDIELVIGKEFGECLECGEQGAGYVHVVGSAVCIACIVVAAPCLDGGLGALYNQTCLTDAVVGLIDGLVAALGAVTEI